MYINTVSEVEADNLTANEYKRLFALQPSLPVGHRTVSAHTLFWQAPVGLASHFITTRIPLPLNLNLFDTATVVGDLNLDNES